MPRSATLCAALAATFLLPLGAIKPACAQQSLSPAQIAPDLTFTELIARHPLSAAERQQVSAIDQDQFHHDPAWSLNALQQEAAGIRNVRRMDPVRLAEWRKSTVAGTYFYTGSRLTPAENKTLLAIYTRANPIVSADTTTKTIICERDIDAWVAASQMMAQKSGASVGGLHAVLTDYARSPKFVGPVRLAAANMERNWTAYQLGWAHEPINDQHSEMADMKKAIHAGLPQSSLPALGNTRSVAIAALTIAQFSYGDYPYSLSPRFAVEKGAIILMIMRTGQKNWETMHALNGYVPGNP